jgi:hypothetical protein
VEEQHRNSREPSQRIDFVHALRCHALTHVLLSRTVHAVKQ